MRLRGHSKVMLSNLKSTFYFGVPDFHIENVDFFGDYCGVHECCNLQSEKSVIYTSSANVDSDGRSLHESRSISITKSIETRAAKQ